MAATEVEEPALPELAGNRVAVEGDRVTPASVAAPVQFTDPLLPGDAGRQRRTLRVRR
jgi:hypothetical protein